MKIQIVCCLLLMGLARGALAGEDRAETGEAGAGAAESRENQGWDAQASKGNERPSPETEPSAWDQPSQASAGNPCTGVTCSYRGQCVVSHGAPTCACYQGYTSNGLNCVPLNQTHAQTRKRRAEDNWMSGDTDADLTVSLDGFVMLIVSIGLAAGSLGFYLGGDSKGFQAAGVVFDVLGAALIISGSVIIGINSGRIDKLRVYRARRRTANIRLEGIGPLVVDRALPGGLGASFSF
jgi:hypothetical protein